MNLTIHTIRVSVAEENQLVGDFLHRSIRRSDRQIGENISLEVRSVICHDGIGNQIIIDGADQTKMNRCGAATVIIGKVVPANRCCKVCGFLSPYSVQIQNPVASVRSNSCPAAFLVLQNVACQGLIVKRCCIVTLRSCPVLECPAICACHTVKNLEQIVVVVLLRGNERSALTGIIVVYDYLFRSPLCVESLILLYHRTRCKRSRTVTVEIPSTEGVALTSGFLARFDLGIIGLLRGASTSTAIGIPCQSVHFGSPDREYRVVRLSRKPRLINLATAIRMGCPTAEFVSIAFRILRELERKLCSVGFALTVYFDSPCKYASSAVSRRYAAAFIVVVKVADVHIALSLNLGWNVWNNQFPLSVIHFVLSRWDFDCS